MRKAKIKEITLNIKGEDVTILKPSVKWLMKMEDKHIDFATGTMDEKAIANELLKLIPNKSYTVEDFIRYEEQSVTVETEDGEFTFVSNEVPYDRYVKAFEKMGEPSRYDFAEAFCAVCGESAEILEELEYEEIEDLGFAFSQLFDTSELDEVMTELKKFRRK